MPLGIRKNDEVAVIRGKFKGQRGKVLHIDRKAEEALVEGINMRWRHRRVNPQTGEGGRLQMESPIHLSNLMLICPKTDKPTRIRTRVSENKTEDGKVRLVKERVSVRAERELGEAVVIPPKEA